MWWQNRTTMPIRPFKDDNESTHDAAAAATSLRGRALKRTQPHEPTSPPAAKRANSRTTSTALPKPKPTKSMSNDDRLSQLAAALEAAVQKIDSLEELIRNELLPRINNPVKTTPPPSPPPIKVAEPPLSRQIPGLGIDVSRMEKIPENAGAIRKKVNEALKEKNMACLGVNDKGNGRYRLLFKDSADVDKIRRDESWIRRHFDKARLYGEQWYPVRLDRVHKDAMIDEMGCELFGKLNGVKVHKLRWIGTWSRPELGSHTGQSVYRSMVVYLDSQTDAAKLLEKRVVTTTGGECAYAHPWLVGSQPARCYRCHLYGHLHYRCKSATSFCGQCALPGHSASTCTSTTFKCASCKGAHKATDPGCPNYRREKEKLRPSTLV